MGNRDFRFGVNLLTPASRADWMRKCREAEELGFDVLAVPDHLGMPAPFPALVLAAEATERVRLTTFTLNAGFYNPTLLARDVVGTDLATDGRFELGLGAGYVAAEFEKAGIPFERPSARVDHLARTLDELERYCADETEPNPVRQPIPVLIGGNGDRMLRLAARRADIVAFIGGGTDKDGAYLHDAEGLAERVRHVEWEASGREIERNLLLFRTPRVTSDRAGELERLAERFGRYGPEYLARCPGLAVGSVAGIAEQLQENRDRYGITYCCANEHNMADFAKVIEYLR